jgi:hypothetical protein
VSGKGRHQSARAHHIFNALKKSNPTWSKSHLWATTMGMSPKTLRRPGGRFKTTPRTYSTTHRRSAIARRMKSKGATKAAIFTKMRSMDSKRSRKGNRKMRTKRR